MKKTTVLAFGNRGGSAGKTTSVVSLAGLLGQAGWKVLVVDADPQADATSSLGVNPAKGKTIGEVMLDEISLEDVIVETTSAPGVSVVPSWNGLDGQLAQMSTMMGPELRLAGALKDLQHRFDVVLIDAPGSGQTMSIATLLPADAAITVTRPAMKETKGIPKFLRLVEDVARVYGRPDLKTVAVIPCDVPPKNAGAIYQRTLELLANQPWSAIITPPVRHSVRVAEAYAAAQPLSLMPTEAVTGDYKAVLDWLGQTHVLDW